MGTHRTHECRFPLLLHFFVLLISARTFRHTLPYIQLYFHCFTTTPSTIPTISCAARGLPIDFRFTPLPLDTVRTVSALFSILLDSLLRAIFYIAPYGPGHFLRARRQLA